MSGKTDPDGDSHMESSSSSDSDSMFPSENDPATPQQGVSRNPRFSHVHGSELSPPHSEERGARDEHQPEFTEAANMHDAHETSKQKEQKDEPGWAWKNPKAREECERSLEYVVDRNFSLREFGELFDENEMSVIGGLRK